MAKNKQIKFAEMEVLKNVFQPKHKEIFQTDYFLKGHWQEKIFQNNHPIVLEIGCGKGEYTVGLSQLYPEKNFIGIDIKGARMWHGAKTSLEKVLSNPDFLRIYAEMLESVFAPCEISEIWITFPDPQMAKARKRLTGSRFLNLYKKILIPNGLIHLKTDSPFLFTYTTELIRQNQLKAFVCTADLYQEEGQNKILGIQTFYEQQWLSRGKTIKYLQFSLEERKLIQEPDIEIEKDNYHSETRYMNLHCKHQSSEK